MPSRGQGSRAAPLAPLSIPVSDLSKAAQTAASPGTKAATASSFMQPRRLEPSWPGGGAGMPT
jgi:hypothetical protein